MKRQLFIFAFWVTLLLSGLALTGQHQQQFPSPKPRQQSDIMLDVFGQFRTVLARYLWFKMDLFHEVLDDEGVDNSRQTEVLPLLRMVSLLDPSLTDSYDNIAWDLYQGHQQAEQALAIVEEGLEHNPQSYQLHFRRSIICYQEKRYQEALTSAQAAVELSQGDVIDALNSNRMMYWSAKHLDDKTLMKQALDQLLALRPEDKLWQKEAAK